MVIVFDIDIVTGKVNGTIDFDPGPGVDEWTSAGLTDAYIVKFDTTGNYQWARTYGGPGEEKVRDIVIDNNNLRLMRRILH